MIDRGTILKILCSLMKRPQYLDETDKYNLTTEDFHTTFDRYVFSAIVNLHSNGAESISVFDIDTYLNSHQSAKAAFERENGIEYLQDGLDLCNADNFPESYKKLKKFNCLKDLGKLGYSTEQFYTEDLTNPKASQINDDFEKLEVSDIFDKLKRDVLNLETKYAAGDASETLTADSGVKDLIESLKKTPEVGVHLQGEIFNTVCRGARRTKFYIRSASSGTGKTRAAVGDACYMAYPVRYDSILEKWVQCGDEVKTLIIATEQDMEEIQTLILAYLTGFDEEKILYSHYTKDEEKIVQQAIEVMEKYQDNLRVVRLSNPSIAQIKAVVTQNWILYGVQSVFYDYIFSSPSLLNEFRDLRIREDVALGMLSTALKDLAVNLGIFVMSSTQTNANAEGDNNHLKNESVIRGSRAIIDKCDIACVMSRVTTEDLQMLEGPISRTGGTNPNQVLDVYKVRRGKFTNVKIWSYMDLSNCRKEDLFMTDEHYALIENYQTITSSFEDSVNNKETFAFLKYLNDSEILVDTNTGEVLEEEPKKVELDFNL